MPALELASTGSGATLFSLFMQANWAVKLVMSGLLLASVWCWAIIFEKMIAFAAVKRASNNFETEFWSGRSLEELYRNLEKRRTTGSAALFMAAMREWKKSFEKGARSPTGLQMRIEKAMDVVWLRESERLQSRLGFLATIGSSAPFIGLFGTVVGIMSAFQSIAVSKNTSLAVVAPGIAEALLATAIGLFAAIPAVIAYNNLAASAAKITSAWGNFSEEFSSILSRQIDERLGSHK